MIENRCTFNAPWSFLAKQWPEWMLCYTIAHCLHPKCWTKVCLRTQKEKSCFVPKMIEQCVALHENLLNKSLPLQQNCLNKSLMLQPTRLNKSLALHLKCLNKVLLCTKNLWTKVLLGIENVLKKSFALHPKCLNKSLAFASIMVKNSRFIHTFWSKVLLCTKIVWKKCCFTLKIFE